jgi:alpha-amylase
MSSICLSIHVHQPFVLRHYSVFDSDRKYFDGYKSRDACRCYAHRAILPANRILIGLLRHFGGRFRFACAVSGAAIDLFERYFPEVLDSFKELGATGCVEYVAMPYHNTLSFLYSRAAFVEQVEAHRRRVREVFNQDPKVFRNSELIYGEEMADMASAMGFSAVMCEGAADVLAGRTCGRVYSGGKDGIALLLRNERLSRDVADRFDDRSWDQWPLTAPKFADWLSRFDTAEEHVNLFWDYATFGLIYPSSTGILDFLRHMPEKVLGHAGVEFLTPSEAVDRHKPAGVYRPSHYISTAERGNNLSAWLGNPMQSHAMHALFSLESAVREKNDPAVLENWRRLQACEYFEAMRTGSDGRPPVGGWRSEPESPYDAYINFMNICDSVCEQSVVAGERQLG